MFCGFTKETFDFMWGIRFNNNKEWFSAHKTQYLDALAKPMKELADEVYASVRSEKPKTELVVHVSRIYRDARRLFGRAPYKDHLWFTLQEQTEQEMSDKPVFWFELDPEKWSYGLGYYMASPMTMRKHRARIDNSPKRLLSLDKLLCGQKEFLLEGEYYKKPKGETTAALAPWYNLKTFSLIHSELLNDAVTRPDLAKRISDGFLFLYPFFEYFSSLSSDPELKE